MYREVRDPPFQPRIDPVQRGPVPWRARLHEVREVRHAGQLVQPG